jgi:hypothetical protein
LAERRRGYFCMSGVAQYQHYQDLVPGVADELRAVREALTGVGLAELFAFTGGERGHAELLDDLKAWARQSAADAIDETLVIYCTGHGKTIGDRWYLVRACSPSDPVGSELDDPADLVEAALKRERLTQVVLILDACYAREGAELALDHAFPLARSIARESKKDLWIVAAASPVDTAKPMVFADAWKTALKRTAADLLQEPYLELAVIMTRARTLSERAANQSPGLVAGESHGCRAFPNPRYMPSELPRPDPPWDAAARGVARHIDPGWYFVPRLAPQRALLEHITASAPDPVVLQLVGTHGTGKTALLGRLITGATAEKRKAIPVVARPATPTVDLDLVASDCRGRDLRTVMEDLGRRVGAPGEDLELLTQRLAGRQCVVLDHVDFAADPEEIVGTLVTTCVAAGARMVIASTRPLLGLEGTVLVDLDDTGTYDLPPIVAYVEKRLLYQYGASKANQMTAGRLSRACHGNFSAAVSAVNELIRAGTYLGLGEKEKSGTNAAQAQLDRICRQTVTETCRRLGLCRDPDGWAATLIGALSVLCDGCTVGLPSDAWARVAHHLNDQDYPVAGVVACAAEATAFLHVVDDRGVIRFRPRYDRPPIQGRLDPNPGRAADALLACTGWPDVLWPEQDLGVTEALACAAARRLGATPQLLDDRRFLLSVPPSQISSALKLMQKGDGQARRVRVWKQVPLTGTAASRSFALSLGAARAGLDALHHSAQADPDRCLDVVAALELPGQEASIIGVSAVSGESTHAAITSHDDGALSLWDLDAGRPMGHLPDVGRGSAVKAVGAFTAADVVHAVALGADGSVRCWRPDGEVCEPACFAERADAIAVHPHGLIAIAANRTVMVGEGCQQRARQRSTIRGHLRGMHFAGSASAPVLWLHYDDGALQRWAILTERAPATVALAPTTHLIAPAPDGSTAAMIDAGGNWTIVGTGRASPSCPPFGRARQFDPPSAALMDDGWLLLAGGHGHGQPWLRLADLTSSTVFTWPIDGSPVGMSGCREGELVLATSHGLALLLPRLSPRAGTAIGRRPR